MGIFTMNVIVILLLFIIYQEIDSTKDGLVETDKTTMTSNLELNPLATLILDRNGIGDVNRSKESTDGNLSRVKRQYGYDPYYSRRNRYPYPLPIFIGGGVGFGGFGGRGFGGRGFGGRGFGGRGFGGRGFGGRGFGGRGFGGIGGRGIGGGGRGGGRG